MLFLFSVPLWLGLILWFIYAAAAKARRDQVVQQTNAWMDTLRRCPECAETIQRDAKVCHFCGCRLEGREIIPVSLPGINAPAPALVPEKTAEPDNAASTHTITKKENRTLNILAFITLYIVGFLVLLALISS